MVQVRRYCPGGPPEGSSLNALTARQALPAPTANKRRARRTRDEHGEQENSMCAVAFHCAPQCVCEKGMA
jgi:hypothetical protein